MLIIIIIAISLSMDAFSLALAYGTALIFSIFSFLFTYFGLNLGKKINNLIGKSSTILGGIILIIIGIIYLIK